jgi:DNA modification methylase
MTSSEENQCLAALPEAPCWAPSWRSECGRVTLYHADCRDVLPTLANVDAVISDPPYGMSWDTNGRRFSGGHRERAEEWSRGRDWGKGIEEDDKPFDPAPWLAFPRCVLFGSNHFGERLPVGTTLVWIKRAPAAFGTFLSDAEMAWMKGGHGVYCRMGPHPESMAQERMHPTQKPVELMAWCMDKAKVAEGMTVLDPYMGSGTTGIACIRTGRRFVGVEKDPTHYQTALERIQRELAQGDLFLPNKADNSIR